MMKKKRKGLGKTTLGGNGRNNNNNKRKEGSRLGIGIGLERGVKIYKLESIMEKKRTRMDNRKERERSRYRSGSRRGKGRRNRPFREIRINLDQSQLSENDYWRWRQGIRELFWGTMGSMELMGMVYRLRAMRRGVYRDGKELDSRIRALGEGGVVSFADSTYFVS